MTVCPACGHDSDCTYRCEECGRDLVKEDDQEIATDGGIPLAGGEDDDPDREYFVVDEDAATVVAGPFEDNAAARIDARDRAPGHIVTTGRVLRMMEETSSQPIRWENDEDDVDIVTDGGFAAQPEPEPTGDTDDLAASMEHPPGKPHHCGICDTFHETITDLVDHARGEHDGGDADA